MAPNTAIALTLFGCAAMLSRAQVGRVWPSNPLAVAILAIGLVALIGDLAPGYYLTLICMLSLYALIVIRRSSADA